MKKLAQGFCISLPISNIELKLTSDCLMETMGISLPISNIELKLQFKLCRQ